jgi:hypothetical protein
MPNPAIRAVSLGPAALLSAAPLSAARLLLPLLLLLALLLAALAGCGTPTLRTHVDSYASYDRTFDTALGAMADQKMILSVQDRRMGNIVAELKGDKVEAALQPMLDGTIRVTFTAPGEPHADAELLKRVVASFNARMAQLSLLGGFKDGDAPGPRGPTPCPSGPAMCP